MKTKVKIYIAVLSLWFAAGAFSTAYLYNQAAHPGYKKLQAEVLWYHIKAKGRNKFMEKLPAFFARFPAVGGVLYFNEKMSLLGSSHEADRLSAAEYEILLKAYTGKVPIPERFREHLHTVTLPDQTRVVFYLQQQLSPAAFFRAMKLAYPYFETIVAGYLFVLVLMAFGLLIAWQSSSLIQEGMVTQAEDAVDNLLRKAEAFGRIRKKTDKSEPQSSGKEANKRVPEQEERLPVSELHFTERIFALLDVMSRQYPLKAVSFYTTENGRWEGVVTKAGGILVRGETFTPLAKELMEPAKRQSWVILEGREGESDEILIGLTHRGHLIGGILATLPVGQKASEGMGQELCTLAREYAQSIFVQRLYDLAINDPETGFYTYPYFYCLIKEKLQSGRNFAVVLFEMDPVEAISPETLRHWSSELSHILKQEGLEPAIKTRLARGKFVLLYHMSHEESFLSNRQEGEIETTDLDRVLECVRRLGAGHFGKRISLFGGFLIRPAQVESADDFFRRLEYLLINSRMEESLLSRPGSSRPAPVFGKAG